MDDRSERLRKRRKQSSRKSPRSDATTDASEEGRTDTPEGGLSASTNGQGGDGQDGGDGDRQDGDDGDGDQTGSVKEERTGTYMYLPDSQLKDLKRLYNVVKAEYEFEYDERFEKNRHFYPLVVQYGLDGLEEMDISEIRESLETV